MRKLEKQKEKKKARLEGREWGLRGKDEEGPGCHTGR